MLRLLAPKADLEIPDLNLVKDIESVRDKHKTSTDKRHILEHSNKAEDIDVNEEVRVPTVTEWALLKDLSRHKNHNKINEWESEPLQWVEPAIPVLGGEQEIVQEHGPARSIVQDVISVRCEPHLLASYGFKSAWCRHCYCQIVSAQAGFPVEMANFLEYLMALQEEERRFVRESFHRNKCTWLVRQLRRTGRIHRRAQYKERIPRRGSSRYPRKDTQRKATLKISKKGKYEGTR